MDKDERKLNDTTCSITHLHGLRNRLYITFIEYSKIIKDTLEPPVLKNSKKIQIKIEEHDQEIDYISDLNSLLSEIKNDCKKDYIIKKNKSNVVFRRQFVMKLVHCYKLAIKTVKMCSSTLRAGIFHPIQRKMHKMVKLISSLSLTSGKFMYGELFKEKRKDSFDLVQHCNELKNILNEYGYNDTVNDEHHNILDELAIKALSKNKLFSANTNQLGMYASPKPKLGTQYAQKWSKKVSEIAENKDVKDDFYNEDFNDIKTAVENFPVEESSINDIDSKLFCTETDNKNISNDTLKQTNLPITSETLTSYKLSTKSNNVGLYVVNVNTLRDFPVKDAKVSKNGVMFLNTSPDDINEIHDYKIQLKTFDDSNNCGPTELLKENSYLSVKEFLSNKVKKTDLHRPKKKIDVSPEEMKEICKKTTKLYNTTTA